MAITIKEIKNLTKDKVIDKDGYRNFDNQEAFSATIKATGITTSEWNGVDQNDNIQVIWNDGTKDIARAIGGKVVKTDTLVTISGLMDVSKYSIGLNGQIAIGPKVHPEAVFISVRIGNLNPKRDWIIDFSDKKDGAPGTSIKLNELVEWIQGKTGDETSIDYPKLKDKDTGTSDKDTASFEIEFKEFHFNITQKTFDFNVASKQGESIKFGDFTIEKVGFRVTNEPIVELEAKKN